MKIIDSKTFARKWIEGYQYRVENPDYRRWHWPIEELNNLTGGAMPGMFYAFVAGAKGGKTSTLLSILLEFSKQNCRVGMYGLEMTMQQLGDRVFANLAGIDLGDIRDVKINPVKMRDIEFYIDAMGNWETQWIDGTTGLITDLKNSIMAAKLEVVIVDYYQLLKTPRHMARTEMLEALSRDLKLLTMDPDLNNITIITAAQANVYGDQKVTSGNVFGSNALERDCDMLIAINPVEDVTGEELPNIREFTVLASRISGVLRFQAAFIPHQAKVITLADSKEEVGSSLEQNILENF